MLRTFSAGLILDEVSDAAWWQHMRLPKHLFYMSSGGGLYGVGHVSPRKAGRHVTIYMKITTHYLTCTAPRVLTGVPHLYSSPGCKRGVCSASCGRCAHCQTNLFASSRRSISLRMGSGWSAGRITTECRFGTPRRVPRFTLTSKDNWTSCVISVFISLGGLIKVTTS